ncbi:hypothetical protein FB45DRAFT_874706 [Roridomyces roridus]|uniref:Uncharacterized protein n=1 Tax=Roridomyces roridus TaxID=1738132 RepID=A0AAD7B8R7_9AGAR|nr:hypothetical protein FB45DRAFT_874706 [Roridomyces roridus]
MDRNFGLAVFLLPRFDVDGGAWSQASCLFSSFPPSIVESHSLIQLSVDSENPKNARTLRACNWPLRMTERGLQIPTPGGWRTIQARTTGICPVFNNPAGNGPCEVEDFCFELGTLESIQCTCTTIDYFMFSACNVCGNDQPLNTRSWSSYAQEFNCGLEPSRMPSLPTTIPAISALPTWVILMASATPTPVTFDAQKAVSFADSESPTTADQSPSSASATAVALAQSSSTTPGSSRSSMSSVRSTASPEFSSSSTSTAASSSLPAPASTSGSQHRALPTAAIIGIAVGSVLLLSLTLLLCRYCRRSHSPIAAGSLQHLDTSDSSRQEYDTNITPGGPESQGTIRPYSVFRSNIPAGYGHGKFNSPLVPPIVHPFHPFKSLVRPTGPAEVDFEPVSESPPDLSADPAGRLRERIAAQEARIRELESQTQMTLTLPTLLRDDGASGVSIPTTGRQPPMYSEGGRGSIL